MADTTVYKTKIKIRNDIEANFQASNPVLLKGEPCVVTDTGEFYIGDGSTAFNALSPFFQFAITKTAAEWSSNVSVYKDGTILVDKTNRIIKVADGVKTFSELSDYPGSVGGGDSFNN